MSNSSIPRRSYRIVVAFATVTLAWPFFGADALAQQISTNTSSTESQAACSCRLGFEQDVIRYKLSYFLGSQVHALSKGGKDVGPTFFTILPEGALGRSDEGVKHLRRARLFHWATLTSGVIAVGLLSGAAVVHFNEKHWSPSAEYLAGGGIAALFVGVLLGYSRQEELMAAIDAYNYDVLNRR